MFFWIWILFIAGAAGFSGGSGTDMAVSVPSDTSVTSTISRPATPPEPASPAAPASPASPDASAAAGGPVYTAEPQVPTGKFTTATEVKPILTATKSSWVAVREYDGRDLVYVTQIMAWRCGLVALRFSVNGAETADWPLPPCHEDTAAPNALTPDDGLPYRSYPLGSVEQVNVLLVYDDLTADEATFQRNQVLMP